MTLRGWVMALSSILIGTGLIRCLSSLSNVPITLSVLIGVVLAIMGFMFCWFVVLSAIYAVLPSTTNSALRRILATVSLGSGTYFGMKNLI